MIGQIAGKKHVFKNTHCYLCGKLFSKLTREHVPFHNLAPKEPDSTFIIIPGCEACNNGLSDLERRFGQFLSVFSSAHPSSKDAVDAWIRDIERNPPKDGTAPRPLLDILGSMHYTEGENSSGHLVEEFTGVIPPDQYQLALLKMALGLHYHYTGLIIPERFLLFAELVTLETIKHYFQGADKTLFGKMKDFFSYTGSLIPSNQWNGAWIFGFYENLYGYAFILDPLSYQNFPRRGELPPMITKNAFMHAMKNYKRTYTHQITQ